MPVPLSVTNPKGVGLAAASPAELPSSGNLFARLGQAANDSNSGGPKQGAAAAADQGQAVQPAAAAAPAGAGSNSSTELAVETCSLSFSYPDLGQAVACRVLLHTALLALQYMCM